MLNTVGGETARCILTAEADFFSELFLLFSVLLLFVSFCQKLATKVSPHRGGFFVLARCHNFCCCATDTITAIFSTVAFSASYVLCSTRSVVVLYYANELSFVVVPPLPSHVDSIIATQT